ncbi:MAG TPA: hypothetical protein PKM78_01035 [Anaerolineae bacterium]|nr:hypothetical protein [Anaerolineae bacterium]HNU05244.1 hypothetical protein [Anaerolineae bacterium]
MTGTPTPSTAQLLDWLENRLPAADAEALAQAVQADAQLQATAAWLSDFLHLSAGVVLADPPPQVHRAASAAFAAYAQSKRPPGIVQTLSALLSSDSWQRLSLAGVRHVTLSTAPRQLIYSSDAADVALNIRAQRDGQGIDLEGQIFPLDETDPAAFVVQLLQEGIERRLTASDAGGKFSLAGLPAGQYELVIGGDRAEIEIGPLELA